MTSSRCWLEMRRLFLLPYRRMSKGCHRKGCTFQKQLPKICSDNANYKHSICYLLLCGPIMIICVNHVLTSTERSRAKDCIETVDVDDENTSDLEMRHRYFGLGPHDRLEVPEAERLWEVVDDQIED